MAGISAAIRLAGTLGATGGGAAGGAIRSAGAVGGTAAGTDVDALKGKIQQLGDSAKLAANPVGLFNSALKEALGPLTKFIGSVQELNSTFVGVYDPARVKLFDMAVKDLYATIGEMLTPITREATEAVKYFSSVFNGVTPLVKDFVNTAIREMKPAFQAIGETWKEFLPLAISLAQITADIQMDIWRGMAVAAKLVADNMRDLYKSLREFLGLPEFQAKDATGKAAANVSQQSTQSYLTNLQLGALRMGKGEDPAVQQVNLLGEIKASIDKLIAELPGKVMEGVTNLPAQIGKEILNAGQGAKDKLDLGGAGARAVAGAMLNRVPAFLGG